MSMLIPQVRAWLATEFGSVENRHRFVCHDETEPIPSDLVFKYREHSWVVIVPNTGNEITLVMPRLHQEDVLLGKFPFPSPLLYERITTAIAPHVSADILVSRDGDMIVPKAGSTDETALEWTLTHKFCHGSIEANQISETHQAFHCRKCGLRFVVPQTVKTYGDLRKTALG